MIPVQFQDGAPELGYWLCAGAFLLIAATAAISRLGPSRKGLMIFACLATSVWAAAMAAQDRSSAISMAAHVAELVRSAAWVALLGSMLDGGRLLRRLVAGVPGRIGIVAIAGVAGLAVLASGFGDLSSRIASATIYLDLFLSVIGLTLIENLYRNSEPDKRWGLKGIFLGLSVIFLFYVVYHADTVLTRGWAPGFVRAQGFVDTLAAPLLLLAIVRGRSWRAQLRVSRRIVFHSTVLAGIGIYLVAMAAMTSVLQRIGGWPALQTIFLVAGGLTLIVVVSSLSFRSKIRVFINKNFFLYKYDYRDVWLKFIHQISHDDHDRDIQAKVLHAVADVFESPAGALWTRQTEDGLFCPKAIWNFGDELPAIDQASSLPHYLDATGWVVDIPSYIRTPTRYPGLKLPDWLLTHPRAWLLVPLTHNGESHGFLVLGTPRVQVEIGWEEIDLLKTLGAQAASYLAEDEASRALQEGRRLEELNRCFAFVVHDIKGLVGQMSLLLENAERHGSDARFQHDVLATVASSVARMRAMLEELRANGSAAQSQGFVDLAAVLREVAERWRRLIPSLQVSGDDGAAVVRGTRETLASIFDHLIQNAFEATGEAGRIELILRQDQDEGVLEVHDDGPGMNAAFVQNELFRPLKTSKSNGFGLGAFQVRQLVRGLGGKLQVDSSPGWGTTMRVRLPIVDDQSIQCVKSEYSDDRREFVQDIGR